VVEGYNISLFNYRLAQYMDFINPLGIEGLDARELRGLCFVFNTDGTVYKRFLLLEKFFNLNQTTESLYENVKHFEIKYINDKIDGSLASFIKLPNGKVIGKSKMGFLSTQAHGINKIYTENIEIKTFVDFCMDNDINAIFEYVAPTNRIVLKYKEEKLILLKLRDNKTGRYLDINDYIDKLGNIEVANFEDLVSLDELIKINETDEDREGYVIHAIDSDGFDFLYKMKNEWYRTRHGILTDEINRENMIIKYILDDQIDDVLAEIPKDEVEVIARINFILDTVRTEITTISNEIEKLYEIFIDMDFNVKEFALKYHKNRYFAGVMSKFRDLRTPFDTAVIMISKETNALESARTWLNKVTVDS
jgi:T4 RnlA family RNA ligase